MPKINKNKSIPSPAISEKRILRQKEEAFSQAFARSPNLEDAAVKAGYKKSNAIARAKQLLKSPLILSRIGEIQKSLPPDAEWALERLKIESLTARADTARVRALGTICQALGLLENKKLTAQLADLKDLLLAREREERADIPAPEPMEFKALEEGAEETELERIERIKAARRLLRIETQNRNNSPAGEWVNPQQVKKALQRAEAAGTLPGFPGRRPPGRPLKRVSPECLSGGTEVKPAEISEDSDDLTFESEQGVSNGS